MVYHAVETTFWVTMTRNAQKDNEEKPTVRLFRVGRIPCQNAPYTLARVIVHSR